MMCAWKELLSILPQRYRREVDQLGRETLEELRLRMGAPPKLVLHKNEISIGGICSREDLNFVVNAASRYSPWTAATIAQGYLTAPGGHRIGLCGETVCQEGKVTGIREARSLCIRVARDFPGVSAGIDISDSALIVGAPGWGKTTLLRDLSRKLARSANVSVIDERQELFPEGLGSGNCLDILTGCPKPSGVEMALRTMGPEWIVVDEITAEQDAHALLSAANCGVKLLATAHAASEKEVRQRRIYKELIDHHVFSTLVILHRDKTYHQERLA